MGSGNFYNQCLKIWTILRIIQLDFFLFQLDKVTMVMNRMDNCEKNPGVIPMHFYNHSIVNLPGGKTAFNGVLVVPEEVGPLTLVS